VDDELSSGAESPTPAVNGLRWWKRFGVRVTAGVIVFVILGGVALLTVPDLLLRNWFPDLTSQKRAAFLGPATTTVLFALGGIIALVGVGLSLSRHRQELDAAARDRERLYDDQEREQARRDEVDAQRQIETERALRERFVTTVKLLSDPAPVNRQAALFALGALADDWDAFGKPDEVQVCIEVLTGYLRAPRSGEMLIPLTQIEDDQSDPSDRREAERTTPQEISVKQAGYTVIARHLQKDAAPHWRGRSLNLAGAHIDFDVDLNGVIITDRGSVNFSDATITNLGSVSLSSATITNLGRLGLYSATITNRGWVNLFGATITNGGHVGLTSATITKGGSVALNKATITNRGLVSLFHATITETGMVALSGATVTDRGSVSIDNATITNRGLVSLRGVTITEDGVVSLRDLTITDSGVVSFQGATIADNVSADILATTVVVGGGSVTLPDGTLHPPAA
jgi:hypothetical protein